MDGDAAQKKGRVYLVGGGPGDPELLTLKALRLLRAADVVVYDSLVNLTILDEARAECRRIFVGKRGGKLCRPQAEIDALLIALARQGKTVVRLKGGDPFVFGRGGEEAEALAAAGIACEAVPGVTAATGAAAATGIPLTHRACAPAVVFLTGHGSDANPDGAAWEDYARLKATLCIYMAMHRLPNIAARLEAAGLPPDTPAAVIQSATTDAQREVVATLGTLVRRTAEEGLGSPAIVIIGEVVRHRVRSIAAQALAMAG